MMQCVPVIHLGTREHPQTPVVRFITAGRNVKMLEGYIHKNCWRAQMTDACQGWCCLQQQSDSTVRNFDTSKECPKMATALEPNTKNGNGRPLASGWVVLAVAHYSATNLQRPLTQKQNTGECPEMATTLEPTNGNGRPLASGWVVLALAHFSATDLLRPPTQKQNTGECPRNGYGT